MNFRTSRERSFPKTVEILPLTPLNDYRIVGFDQKRHGERFLRVVHARDRHWQDARKVDTAGAVTEYVIDGKRYLYVTSTKNFDVVRCPDKTYGKVDRKTKTFLGPYSNNES